MLPIIGWREWVVFPGFDGVAVKAKVDSGAKSSSLHAEAMEFLSRKRRPYVRFLLTPRSRDRAGQVVVTVPLHDQRMVRSSNGQAERRPVIVVPIRLFAQEYLAEITLTQRRSMGYPMLLGRQALCGRFVIDPHASYVAGRPPRPKKRIAP